MRNYKMTIAYDGTNYQGWQRQANTKKTIQEILERALGAQVGYPVTIDGSGRTDGGVHAYGQVANVKLSGKVDEETFLRAVNERLPEDIRIRKLELVKNGFHSRYSAVAKRYEYTIDLGEKAGVFQRKYCYHYPRALDVSRMRKAAAALTGRHDFTAFTDKKDEKSTVRTIYDIQIEETGNRLRIAYYGDGFMYHMVRILTGTLIEVGNGERKPEEIMAVLQSGRRADAGFLAPALGLCLKEVLYETK